MDEKGRDEDVEGGDAHSAHRPLMSDISLLLRALETAVEFSFPAAKQHDDGSGGRGGSSSSFVASPWSLSQRRLRSMTHFALVVQVLEKKSEMLELLVSDALSLLEKEREAAVAAAKERLQNVGDVMSGGDACNISAPQTYADPSALISPAAQIDPTLLPPGLDEEDYHEENCFRDIAAPALLNENAEGLNGGIVRLFVRPESPILSPTCFSVTAVPHEQPRLSSLDRYFDGEDRAERCVQWLRQLLSKISLEALPVERIARRCGLGDDLHLKCSRGGVGSGLSADASLPQNTSLRLGNRSLNEQSIDSPTVEGVASLSASSSPVAPLRYPNYLSHRHFSGLNPLLFFTSHTSTSTTLTSKQIVATGIAAPATGASPSSLKNIHFPSLNGSPTGITPVGHVRSGSNSLASPLSSSRTEDPQSLGSDGSRQRASPLPFPTPLGESAPIPTRQRFCFSLFLASLRWNVGALLWSDGQVAECGKWLAGVPTDEIWRSLLLQEKDEEDTARTGKGRRGVKDDFSHANQSRYVKHDTVSELPLYLSDHISWEALLEASVARRDAWRASEASCRPGAHSRFLLHRLAALRDVCRLCVSCESHADIAALLPHLSGALQRQEEFLWAWISEQKKLNEGMKATEAEDAEHKYLKIAEERQADTVAQILILLHVAVEHCLATRSRFLFRHRLIQDETYAAMLKDQTEGGREGVGVDEVSLPGRGGKASTSYIRSLEKDAVRSACSELVRRISKNKCQSIYELEERGLPSATYASPFTRIDEPLQSPDIPPCVSSSLVDAALPYVWGVNVLQITLNFASSYKSSQVYRGIATREEINFHSLLSTFILERQRRQTAKDRDALSCALMSSSRGSAQTGPQTVEGKNRANSQIDHHEKVRGGAASTEARSVSCEVLPNTSASSFLLASGSNPVDAVPNGAPAGREPFAWQRRSKGSDSGVMGRVKMLFSAVLVPSPSAKAVLPTPPASAESCLTSSPLGASGAVSQKGSTARSSVGNSNNAESRHRGRAAYFPPATVKEQLLEAYKLFTKRYYSRSLIFEEEEEEGERDRDRKARLRRKRWISPPRLDDSDEDFESLEVPQNYRTPFNSLQNCQGGGSTAQQSLNTFSAIVRCCRLALGLDRPLHDSSRQPTEARRDASGGASSSSTECSPPLVCLWLPSRGAIPLLPEEKESCAHDWGHLASAESGSRVVESLPPPGDTVEAGRRMVSLRLLVLLHYLEDIEEAGSLSTAVTSDCEGRRDSAEEGMGCRWGGLHEYVPPASLRILVSELNKALYLLPQRIKKMPNGGEEWWNRWEALHKHQIKNFYTKALYDVYYLEEKERLAASSKGGNSTDVPPPSTGANHAEESSTSSWWRSRVVRSLSPDAIERRRNSRVRADGQEKNPHSAAELPYHGMQAEGQRNNTEQFTPLPLGNRQPSTDRRRDAHEGDGGPSAECHSGELTSGVFPVAWDLPPFFLPEVRLDVSAFTAASIETQESMRKTAEELSVRQAECDAVYRLAYQQGGAVCSCAAPCAGDDTNGLHSLFSSVGVCRDSQLSPAPPVLLSVLDAASRHRLHDVLPFISQFVNWKMIYNSSTHGMSLQTLYQCCAAEGSRSREARTPMLVVIEVMPSFTLSFERDGEGVRQAAAAAQAAERRREGVDSTPPPPPRSPPNSLVVGAYLSDLLLCDTRRFYGTSDCFVFQRFQPGQGGPPDLRVYRSSGENSHFINCRRTSILIGGGGLGVEGGGSALFIDSSLARGATTSCPTFSSPPLTELDQTYVMTSGHAALQHSAKSFEIIRVEAVVFEN